MDNLTKCSNGVAVAEAEEDLLLREKEREELFFLPSVSGLKQVL